MEQTAASAQEITAATADIDSQVDEMAWKAKDGAGVSKQITERALLLKKESLESAINAKKLYEDVKGKMEEAIRESNTITQISVLADTILSITGQLNLLAVGNMKSLPGSVNNITRMLSLSIQ